MNREWLLKYALPTLLIAILIAGGVYQSWQRAEDKITTINCPDPLKGCQFQMHHQQISVNFVEPPSGLHPFTVRVSNAEAKVIYAYFTMRDMEMGYNRYRLTQQSPQHWQAKVVLPVCVTGRHDWLLTLDIDGEKVAIPFSG